MTDVRSSNPKAPRQEYRVVWKRRGQHRKSKRFATLVAAKRRERLLGPEPWTAFEKGADDPACCSGHNCDCGGETLREKLLRERQDGAHPEGNGMPPIEYIRIERRPLADWEVLSCVFMKEGALTLSQKLAARGFPRREPLPNDDSPEVA